jgi:hypothetical protein
MFEAIKQTAEGAKVISDWLGHGGSTVPKEQAEARADICRSCPQNIKGDWWNRAVGGVADVIRLHLQAKASEKLQVKNEHELGTCGACLCNTILKVWCPIEHIKKYTPESTLEKYDPKCWVKHEYKNTRAN